MINEQTFIDNIVFKVIVNIFYRQMVETIHRDEQGLAGISGDNRK